MQHNEDMRPRITALPEQSYYDADGGMGTLRMIRGMQEESVSIRRENGDYVVRFRACAEQGDVESAEPIVIPPRYRFVEELLFLARKEGEERPEYAERLELHTEEISMVIAPSRSRRLQRDLLINILMLCPQVPDVESVNHTLMAVCQPGLFLWTYDPEDNRRNLILIKIFRMAHRGSCGREPVQLLQKALLYYDLAPTLRSVRESLREGNVPEEYTALTGRERELFESWREELAAVRGWDYTLFRRELLEQNREEPQQSNVELCRQLRQRLPEAVQSKVSESAFLNFFASKPDPNRNRTSRTGIICIAAALGCGRREANRLLMEANHAFVYPKSSFEEERQLANLVL